jgi:hypothetical protein
VEEERTFTSGFSVPRKRRAALEAALLKLKTRRPFDSKSEIIIDAVLAAAEQLDQDGHESHNGDGQINRAPELQSVAA